MTPLHPTPFLRPLSLPPSYPTQHPSWPKSTRRNNWCSTCTSSSADYGTALIAVLSFSFRFTALYPLHPMAGHCAFLAPSAPIFNRSDGSLAQTIVIAHTTRSHSHKPARHPSSSSHPYQQSTDIAALFAINPIFIPHSLTHHRTQHHLPPRLGIQQLGP